MAFDKQRFWSKAKKIGIVTLWVAMVSGVLVSLAFVNSEEADVTCSEIVVRIGPQSDLHFVDREMIIRTIRNDGDEKKIIGKKITALNTPNLERKLLTNKLIRTAEVFTDMNGGLHINVSQREPILRVVNANGNSFYIDRDGGKMPVSSDFTARVPVASGNIFEHCESAETSDSLSSFIGSELFKIATYVDKDAFWKAQIEQIFVTAGSELVLIPAVGDHIITFGSTENMDDKFNRLMVFYREALSRVGWDKYKNIDLRYKDQVVCKKKN